MTFHPVLTPAYGRDYNSLKALRLDWLAGKDFLAQPHGQYCSIRDFPSGTKLQARYAKLRKVSILETP